MTQIYSPDEVSGWDDVRPIDRAVMLQEYRLQIEEELDRIKALVEESCRLAREQDDTEADDWKLQIRYASGTSRSPDAEMLAVEDPEAYKSLYEEQVKKWKPKLTKTDMEWLYSDKDRRDEMMEKVSVEHLVKTQYILVKKEASE